MPVMYTIKEFEKLSHISSHNLRYFDKIGLLCPQRDANGYRVYALPQVAIAEMITILQKAKVPNGEIKSLFSDYTSQETITKLKTSQQELHDYIAELNSAYATLSKHVGALEKICSIKNNLDKPFVEDRPEIVVGTVALETDNIVEFFERVGDIYGEQSWYLLYDYGFIINKNEVESDGYPLTTMYCDVDAVINNSAHTMASGRYMSMYCAGSLENNKKVYELIKHAKECGYKSGDRIYIENVSGPAIEVDKKDFVIKIMIPLLI